MSATTDAIQATLTALASRRGSPLGPLATGRTKISGNANSKLLYPATFLELNGARIIEVTAFEPDAMTYRGEYYYNAILNRLYRRIITKSNGKKIQKAHWVSCSE